MVKLQNFNGEEIIFSAEKFDERKSSNESEYFYSDFLEELLQNGSAYVGGIQYFR